MYLVIKINWRYMYKNLTDTELIDLKNNLEKEISSLNNQQQATKIA